MLGVLLGTPIARNTEHASHRLWQQKESHSEALQLDTGHYRKLYTCMSLFCVLYLPENGLEDAPVGDELMDWLNRLYIQSTDDGDHLSGLDRPWEDPIFWGFLSRFVYLPFNP